MITRIILVVGAIALFVSAALAPVVVEEPEQAEAHGPRYERTCVLRSGVRLYYLNNHQAYHLQQVLAGLDGARAASRTLGSFGVGFRLPFWFGATNLTSYNVWLANRASGWRGVKIGQARWGPLTVGLLVAPRNQGANC